MPRFVGSHSFTVVEGWLADLQASNPPVVSEISALQIVIGCPIIMMGSSRK
jgi:hypothetical protein